MKAVSGSLGVARSALMVRLHRPEDWQDGRRHRSRDDAALVAELKAVIVDLPSDGYRRAWGVLRRQRDQLALPRVNRKRVYRGMREHGLLLARGIKRPGQTRRHEGRVAVAASDTRWCSDGFEFNADNGEKLRVTFALDCCDREALSWVASRRGYSGDDPGMQSAEQRDGGELRPDDEAGLHRLHAKAGRENRTGEPGAGLCPLQRAPPAQRAGLPVLPGVQTAGDSFNLRRVRVS